MLIIGIIAVTGYIHNKYGDIESETDSNLYLPGLDDYVMIRGKMRPNSSKNPRRQLPTR